MGRSTESKIRAQKDSANDPPWYRSVSKSTCKKQENAHIGLGLGEINSEAELVPSGIGKVKRGVCWHTLSFMRCEQYRQQQDTRYGIQQKSINMKQVCQLRRARH